jgi:hypothetical protein
VPTTLTRPKRSTLHSDTPSKLWTSLDITSLTFEASSMSESEESRAIDRFWELQAMQDGWSIIQILYLADLHNSRSSESVSQQFDIDQGFLMML